MIRTLLVLVLLTALAAPGASAKDDSKLLTAADVTERGRPLDRILDMALAPRGEPHPDGRAIVVLVDVTASLAKAELSARFAEAVERQKRKLVGARIGVARAGERRGIRLDPTEDFASVRLTLREMCQVPGDRFQNVYADVRRVAKALQKEKGRREILLITVENGDAEDNVESTVKALRRGDIRLSVVCREAFFSDAYWVLEEPDGPEDTTFTGAESAFVELPWGFRYQGMPGTVSVPSGFGMYGLTRLAASSGGRVFLYYPGPPLKHSCIHSRWGYCPFCTGDHEPPGEGYQGHRLRVLAPLAVSRREVVKIAARDPYYRAVLRAWDDLCQEDLIYIRPSVSLFGQGPTIEDYPYKGWGPLGYTTAFISELNHVRRLRRALEQILKNLERDIDRAEDGLERYRAIAETTRVLLYVTRVNLALFEAFCDDVGPYLEAASAREFEPPEIWPYKEGGRFQLIGYRSMSLCHGPKPFRDLRLPGAKKTQKALDDLIRVWTPFERRYAHTPFLLAMRRTGLARFHLVWNPGYVPYGRRSGTSKGEKKQKTKKPLPKRPTHPGRTPSSGGGGRGPTTGR